MESVVGVAPLTGFDAVLSMAKDALRLVHGLPNDEFKEDLEERAMDLLTALESVPKTCSPEASDRFEIDIRDELTILERSLSSVIEIANENALKDCRTMVEILSLQVKDLINEQRSVHNTTTGCHDLESPSLVEVRVRIRPVLDFLVKSSSQDLRVVCICGQAGLGKSTLLHHLWRQRRERTACLAEAFVNVGAFANHSVICGLQTSILWQLGKATMRFSDSSFGRYQLRKSFGQLKDDGKPVFLAIDNVFSSRDLELLLPSLTSSNSSFLPVKSCIVLTCRDGGVFRSLLGICGIQEDNRMQVFCYNPPLLSPQASKRLFVDCAGIQLDASEHKELLGAVDALCRGLPLALTVLAKDFRSMQPKSPLQLTEKEMPNMEGYMTLLRTVGQPSYDRLNKSCQAAFLDIVELFYGWPWDVVECIVGESCRSKLKDSSLISQVEWLECSQGLVSNITSSLYNYFYSQGMDVFGRQGCVWMDELTHQFGKCILRDNTLGYKQFNNQVPSDSTESINSSLRNLIWTADTHDTQLVSHLTNTSILQMLAMSSHLDPSYTGSCCEKSLHFQQGDGNLGYLMLGNLDGLENSVTEAKVSSDIRGIHLKNCSSIESLPPDPLLNLQILWVDHCSAFLGFSEACVGRWDNLKSLILISCPAIVKIPEEVGYLSSLQFVAIYHCDHFVEFPALRSNCGASRLILENCSALMMMGSVSCHLEKLRISRCKLLARLPRSICGLMALEILDLTGCESLVELPWDMGNIASLKTLVLQDCKGLQQLPSSICRLMALEVLDLTGCERLSELTEEIEDVASLKTLLLKDCKGLQHLPISICGLMALEVRDLTGCERLSSFQRKLETLPP